MRATALVWAGVVREAGHRPGLGRGQHTGISCVSCPTGRLMLRG